MPSKEPKESASEVPHIRKEARPDFSKLPAHKSLPDDVQKMLDNETVLEQIYDGNAPETTDTSLRYAAYATRVRTLLLSAQRYVAYTSDIGESFRPVAHPYLIRGAYAVSWAYLLGDVGHEGYKARLRNELVRDPARAVELVNEGKRVPGAELLGQSGGRVAPLEDWRTVMAQRAVFQSIASMALPAFTIHSIVRYSGRALKGVKNVRVRSYTPIGLGLAAVPFLPYLFDKPVEEGVEWAFFQAFRAIGGEQAAGQHPHAAPKRPLPPKEKEL
ncbi:MAG: hypothetical protein M1829_002500 [Trizodia sp. TS-e1964]|nr:MAG: hypothetical protein M1829_002500 [Trizodia sp. TS-e1964]